MKAAIYKGPGKIEVGEREKLEPGEGEVRVRIEACGICGSDLHFLHENLPIFPVGQTPGHEIAGRVDVVGSGVADFGPGDGVVVEPLVSCCKCFQCVSGRESICPEFQFRGVHRPGGFAEFITVPARRLFRVPKSLDVSVAALAEPVAVVVHGFRRSELTAGQRVLVLGAGSIGLAAVGAAKAMGAGEVWLSARHAHQAELGKKMGAARVLNEEEASPESLTEIAMKTHFDIVVETVGGTAKTMLAAGAAVGQGGTVCVLGLFMGPVTLDPFPLLFKEANLRWSNCYGRPKEGPDFAEAIRIISEDPERFAQLITHRMPLDQIAEAVEVAADKKSKSIKVAVLVD